MLWCLLVCHWQCHEWRKPLDRMCIETCCYQRACSYHEGWVQFMYIIQNGMRSSLLTLQWPLGGLKRTRQYLDGHHWLGRWGEHRFNSWIYKDRSQWFYCEIVCLYIQYIVTVTRSVDSILATIGPFPQWLFIQNSYSTEIPITFSQISRNLLLQWCICQGHLIRGMDEETKRKYFIGHQGFLLHQCKSQFDKHALKTEGEKYHKCIEICNLW